MLILPTAAVQGPRRDRLDAAVRRASSEQEGRGCEGCVGGSCVVGVTMLVVVACGGGEAQPPENQPGDTDVTERGPRPQATHVELTVRRPPRDIEGDDVLVRGTVMPADAAVTVRGEAAAVKDGEYQVRLKMRVGTNRFTVVARHPDRQTNWRALRVDREPPVPAADESSSSGCPPGQVPRIQMGARYCRPPGPKACPPGQTPAGEEACAPEPESDGLAPCIYGPREFCTPQENQTENEAEGRCGPLDPARFEEEGAYIPLPGC